MLTTNISCFTEHLVLTLLRQSDNFTGRQHLQTIDPGVLVISFAFSQFESKCMYPRTLQPS